MKIHTDNLTPAEIYEALPAGVHAEIEERGSRKRARALVVYLSAVPGFDRYGVKRRYQPTRANGTATKAATWQDWGDFIAACLTREPSAICGKYDGSEAFIRITQDEATRRAMYRGEDEAYTAATRWADLIWSTEAVPA